MHWPNRLVNAHGRLDLVAGLVDGILNALTLAAGRLLRDGGGASLGLAVRVAIATGLTTIFVFFIAHYAELRADLIHAERELNLLSHGRLATSQLGRRAIGDAATGAIMAATCGVLGAFIPLLLCTYLPAPKWVGLALILALLGILGAALARSVGGSIGFWAGSVLLAGAALTFVGVQLDITG
jgi:VIT1/CCC1 family predicted Fe2+/Mn2+ transporter